MVLKFSSQGTSASKALHLGRLDPTGVSAFPVEAAGRALRRPHHVHGMALQSIPHQVNLSCVVPQTTRRC